MTSRYPGGLVRKNAANTAITGASGVWDLGSQAQAVRNNTWPISGLALPVSGSLRFRSSASAYLNRTFGTPTDNLKWTWSGWVKRGELGTSQTILGGYSQGTGQFPLYFTSSNLLAFYDSDGVSTYYLIGTAAVFRDPSVMPCSPPARRIRTSIISVPRASAAPASS